MEVWPARSRPLMAGLIGASANVGFLIIGVLGLGVVHFIGTVGGVLGVVLPQSSVDYLLRNGGWRLLFLLGAIPAVLTFFIRIFVPESEKWQKAVKTAPKPQLREIFAPGVRRHAFLGLGLAGLVLLGTWGSVQWIPAWASQIANDPTAAAWTQICLAAGASVGAFSMALLAEKLNRRRTYFLLMLGTLTICQIFFRAPIQFGTTFLVLAFFTTMLSGGFYGWLPLYLPELFPTRIRATGSGFAYNAGRIVAAGGTIGAGALTASFGGDFARMGATMSLLYLVGTMIIWLGPETKGRPLPE
jgi:MFS family permease